MCNLFSILAKKFFLYISYIKSYKQLCFAFCLVGSLVLLVMFGYCYVVLCVTGGYCVLS
jgi:hypothetical protein